MTYTMKIEKKYIGIPIQAEWPEEEMAVFCGDKQIFEFKIPVCKEKENVKYDFYSYLDVSEYKGQELTITGDLGDIFFENICQCDEYSYEELKRPLLHFTAERGWINDPNGMVYHNGQYHLYFQYNPMNTKWQNMSWGHSVSTDLLHFKQVENVMYPDEHGTMFSGCGLVNDREMLGLPKDALLFFYTTAGRNGTWSKDVPFEQRIAYSLDEGKTLVKMPEAVIGEIGPETRDTKVFWHEESKAYITPLYIEGNEFRIFRSENLKDWTETDRFVLPKAWECPDLFKLDCEGESVWVFTTADGFYYLGEFDGYKFNTDGVQKMAYMTRLPYAAQSYSNVEGRVISIPWIRTLNKGRMYTGMMGLPRELKLVKVNGEKVLSMVPVREYEEAKKQITQFDWNGKEFSVEISHPAVAEVELQPQEGDVIRLNVYEEELIIKENTLTYKDETIVFAETLKDIHVIVDREIIEVHANNGTGNAYFETESDKLQGRVKIEGCNGKGKIFIWQP